MAIEFKLNGELKSFEGDGDMTLLHYLRDVCGIMSPKDGCSAQAACGACMVQVNGKPTLSCVTKLAKLQGSEILTLEGFPQRVRDTLARSFVKHGAVQCGFCTPGFLVRAAILLESNPAPSPEEIKQALKNNFCRCTGYKRIISAIEEAARLLREGGEVELPAAARAGGAHPKYDALNRALGQSPFVDDLRFAGMLHGALKFSDHPRARVLSIDTSEAQALAGVIRVFTAQDIPGQRITGLIVKDWPMMVAVGEVTRYIGDVLASVVAETEALAREAVQLIKVEYEVLEPLTDMRDAEHSPIQVHENGNLLEVCRFSRGENVDRIIEQSAHVARGVYETQRIEHAFLETETAIARPWGEGGVELFSQGQGVYVDRSQIAVILGIPEEQLKVNLVPMGGGFGGKEDLSVQGHVALFAYALKRVVKLHLRREESLRMHPKRHPILMDYVLACDEKGMLTALKARIIGDTGAYASVGMKVLERAAGHATGGYTVPNVDIEGKTLYTNNIPCGAMRGFGANQATYAMECCVEELCAQGGFDSWQFRYDNALVEGSTTATGQVLDKSVGVRETLLAVKEQYDKARYPGLGCGIKNCGVGNGMPDDSVAEVEILPGGRAAVYHGWTEMGQGVNTVAVQILAGETGIAPEKIEVRVSTTDGAKAGMTTSSRGTSLLGNSLLEAIKPLKEDLKTKTLEELAGRTYTGYWVCDWSTKPGDPGDVVTHYSYSYATQLVTLDEEGFVDHVYAAHDAGKIMNPTLFASQIEGSVHMGLGYALSEDLPMEGGRLKSTRLRDLGILKAHETPPVTVIGIEVKDTHGPYGAKGVGEIGLVPTAGAVANALFKYDGKRRYKLPMRPYENKARS